MKKRLLRHVRQHCIRAAEGYHRRFAKEKSFVKECAPPSFPQTDRHNRRKPQTKPDCRHFDRSRPRGPRMFGRFGGVAQDGLVNFTAVTADDIKLPFPKSAAD